MSRHPFPPFDAPDDHSWLHGVIADLPTPFDGNDRPDLVSFARLCERQIRAGASAIVVGDTVGEGDLLDDEERSAVIRTAVAMTRGRVRVIAGTGSNCTRRAIVLARLAQAAGADAAMSVVPYYNRPTPDGIAAHFKTILSETTLPLILHDAPARCARALTDAVIADLAVAPQLVGLRDDTGDAVRLARLRSQHPGMRWLTGADSTALAYLLAGGDGVVSAVANMTPQLSRAMYHAARQGCPRYATTISDMLMPLAETLTPDQVTSAVKHALGVRGLGTTAVRLPRLPLPPDQQRRVETALAAIWAAPDEAMWPGWPRRQAG